MAEDNSKELVLPVGTFAYVLDETKGQINVNSGPFKTSLSNTDKLVRYNSETKRFDPAGGRDAIQINVVCAKGNYVILENPARRQPGIRRLGMVVGRDAVVGDGSTGREQHLARVVDGRSR